MEGKTASIISSNKSYAKTAFFASILPLQLLLSEQSISPIDIPSIDSLRQYSSSFAENKLLSSSRINRLLRRLIYVPRTQI